MKLLIAIMTCHKLDYFIDDLTIDWCTQHHLRCTDQSARVNTIRATWVKDLPADVDYRFFYGTKLRDTRPNQRTPDKIILREPLGDEIFLDCGDSYTSNPDKMIAICRWALERGYEYILRCDDDTFIYPNRLLATNWNKFDYVGAGKDATTFHPGGCMFLSRHAMELIVKGHPTTYADDVWIGQLMRESGIPLTNEPTMRNQWGEGYKVPLDIDPTGISSFHSCTPDVMQVLHSKK
jgi:hypothetical protein